MSDKTELKPCPICNESKARLSLPTCEERTPYDPSHRAYPIVRCGGCGTEVPGDNWDHTGKSAVTKWNRRSSVQEAAPATAADGLADAAIRLLSDARYFARRWSDPKAVADYIDEQMACRGISAARAVAPAGVPEVTGELRYFAHDASGGVTDFFATEAEAIAFAEEGVKVASEAANDDGEWEEGADQIYVGIVTHRAILQERDGGTYDLTFGPLSASPTPTAQGMGWSVLDDIRAAGWAVAVHNDYRLHGQPHTFWLFTKGDRAVKGEGLTDAEALNEVRRSIGLASAPSTSAGEA